MNLNPTFSNAILIVFTSGWAFVLFLFRKHVDLPDRVLKIENRQDRIEEFLQKDLPDRVLKIESRQDRIEEFLPKIEIALEKISQEIQNIKINEAYQKGKQIQK